MSDQRPIVLRGVAVHNLKAIDLDLPARRLTVVCGVSGSGKSSLAIDTLYAEGQRRYIESFAPFVRQFVARLEKPKADRIDGVRPAIAIDASRQPGGAKATVGGASEAIDYLRLLYAKCGRPYCPRCGRPVRRDSPQSVRETLQSLAAPPSTRVLVGFPDAAPLEPASWEDRRAGWQRDGFVRVVVDGKMRLVADPLPPLAADAAAWIVVDRLTLESAAETRWLDALELAFHRGQGRACVWIEGDAPAPADAAAVPPPAGELQSIDDRPWRRWTFGRDLRCEPCGLPLPDPTPKLFNPEDPQGACLICQGQGTILDVDPELVVPRPGKSLRAGALEPWTPKEHQQHWQRLLEVGGQLGVPLDAPYADLSAEAKEVVWKGSKKDDYLGLKPFFLELAAAAAKSGSKVALRSFLSRFQSPHPCPACHGARLREEALAFMLEADGKRISIAAAAELEAADALAFLQAVAAQQQPYERRVGQGLQQQLEHRLKYMVDVGLGYLSLSRPLATLSTGEAQRTALTKALGSSLVDTLYVLDEPSVGLHAGDVERLLAATERLCRRGNTVVVVEHDEAFIQRADHVVEIGPGAGDYGGKIVFQGPPADLPSAPGSVTGDFLAGRRGRLRQAPRRKPEHGWIKVQGARGNNLRNVDVAFPLGVLCVVAGVSGAGKSSLVQDTLHPAFERHFHQEGPKPLPYGDVVGMGQVQECILMDQTPVGRSPRSNPVTYVKAFEEIRAVFAGTAEARMRNLTASHFSFNSADGRCGQCEGDGALKIDMQFLPDVYVTCPACRGARYREEVLAVTYRDRTIAEVLQQTAREAFGFFRGHPKVQARLKPLIDVGLDYLRLGQAANTLSGGESQRLKLAGHLGAARKTRTLFILDEPTTGLHAADVVQLLDCLEALLAVGHSLLVVEHNLHLIAAADYVIDVGPGAAAAGGRIVAAGTPEEVAAAPESVTGRFLRDYLRSHA